MEGQGGLKQQEGSKPLTSYRTGREELLDLGLQARAGGRSEGRSWEVWVQKG